jgi:DNA invertase Pin-like site-specific DNA recombinase
LRPHAFGSGVFRQRQPIDMVSTWSGLDTTTPAGKAQMMGVFAEFERSMIQERVRAGLARAKSEGKRRDQCPIRGLVPAVINRARLSAY